MHEHLAVHSALGFWRELLHKEFNSSQLHVKGMEISRSYQKIQDFARKIEAQYTDDIKFLFRYG